MYSGRHQLPTADPGRTLVEAIKDPRLSLPIYIYRYMELQYAMFNSPSLIVAVEGLLALLKPRGSRYLIITDLSPSETTIDMVLKPQFRRNKV